MCVGLEYVAVAPTAPPAVLFANLVAQQEARSSRQFDDTCRRQVSHAVSQPMQAFECSSPLTLDTVLWIAEEV
jgi:hypothetical protein